MVYKKQNEMDGNGVTEEDTGSSAPTAPVLSECFSESEVQQLPQCCNTVTEVPRVTDVFPCERLSPIPSVSQCQEQSHKPERLSFTENPFEQNLLGTLYEKEKEVLLPSEKCTDLNLEEQLVSQNIIDNQEKCPLDPDIKTRIAAPFSCSVSDHGTDKFLPNCERTAEMLCNTETTATISNTVSLQEIAEGNAVTCKKQKDTTRNPSDLITTVSKPTDQSHDFSEPTLSPIKANEKSEEKTHKITPPTEQEVSQYTTTKKNADFKEVLGSNQDAHLNIPGVKGITDGKLKLKGTVGQQCKKRTGRKSAHDITLSQEFKIVFPSTSLQTRAERKKRQKVALCSRETPLTRYSRTCKVISNVSVDKEWNTVAPNGASDHSHYSLNQKSMTLSSPVSLQRPEKSIRHGTHSKVEPNLNKKRSEESIRIHKKRENNDMSEEEVLQPSSSRTRPASQMATNLQVPKYESGVMASGIPRTSVGMSVKAEQELDKSASRSMIDYLLMKLNHKRGRPFKRKTVLKIKRQLRLLANEQTSEEGNAILPPHILFKKECDSIELCPPGTVTVSELNGKTAEEVDKRTPDLNSVAAVVRDYNEKRTSFTKVGKKTSDTSMEIKVRKREHCQTPTDQYDEQSKRNKTVKVKKKVGRPYKKKTLIKMKKDVISGKAQKSNCTELTAPDHQGTLTSRASKATSSFPAVKIEEYECNIIPPNSHSSSDLSSCLVTAESTISTLPVTSIPICGSEASPIYRLEQKLCRRGRPPKMKSEPTEESIYQANTIHLGKPKSCVQSTSVCSEEPKISQLPVKIKRKVGRPCKKKKAKTKTESVSVALSSDSQKSIQALPPGEVQKEIIRNVWKPELTPLRRYMRACKMNANFCYSPYSLKHTCSSKFTPEECLPHASKNVSPDFTSEHTKNGTRRNACQIQKKQGHTSLVETVSAPQTASLCFQYKPVSERPKHSQRHSMKRKLNSNDLQEISEKTVKTISPVHTGMTMSLQQCNDVDLLRDQSWKGVRPKKKHRKRRSQRKGSRKPKSFVVDPSLVINKQSELEMTMEKVTSDKLRQPSIKSSAIPQTDIEMVSSESGGNYGNSAETHLSDPKNSKSILSEETRVGKSLSTSQDFRKCVETQKPFMGLKTIANNHPDVTEPNSAVHMKNSELKMKNREDFGMSVIEGKATVSPLLTNLLKEKCNYSEEDMFKKCMLGNEDQEKSKQVGHAVSVSSNKEEELGAAKTSVTDEDYLSKITVDTDMLTNCQLSNLTEKQPTAALREDSFDIERDVLERKYETQMETEILTGESTFLDKTFTNSNKEIGIEEGNIAHPLVCTNLQKDNIFGPHKMKTKMNDHPVLYPGVQKSVLDITEPAQFFAGFEAVPSREQQKKTKGMLQDANKCSIGIDKDRDGAQHDLIEKVKNNTRPPTSSLLRRFYRYSVKTRKNHVQCRFCGQFFRRITTFAVHLRIHTGEKPYGCRDCGKKFFQLANLNAHRMVHKPSGCMHCPYCKSKFFHREKLLSHFKIHVQNQSTQIVDSNRACAKTELHPSDLADGLNLSKPFSCIICSKAFRHSTMLKHHIRTHTTLKAFSCRTCGKAFSQTSDLSAHERDHWSVKPYACSICGKGFNRIRALKCHSQTHSGEKPFSCASCGNAYTELSSLRKHQASKVCLKGRQEGEENNSGLVEFLGLSETLKPVAAVYDEHCAKGFTPQCDRSYTCMQTKTVTPNLCEHKKTLDISAHISSSLNEDVAVCIELSPARQTSQALHDDQLQPHTSRSLQSPDSQQQTPSSDCVELEDDSNLASMCETAKKSENPELLTCSSLQKPRCKIKSSECSSTNDASLAYVPQINLASPNEDSLPRHCIKSTGKTLKRYFMRHRWPLLGRWKKYWWLKSICRQKRGPFVCSECNQCFRFANLYIDHLQEHLEQNPFLCLLCHLTFSDNDVLKAHQREKHSRRKNKCSYCGKGFINVASLKKHRLHHSGPRSLFCCSHCSRSFSHMRALQAHLRTFNKLDILTLPEIPSGSLLFPYKCKRCNARFRTLDVLTLHENSHSHKEVENIPDVVPEHPFEMQNYVTPAVSAPPHRLLCSHAYQNDSLYDYPHPDSLYVYPSFAACAPPLLHSNADMASNRDSADLDGSNIYSLSHLRSAHYASSTHKIQEGWSRLTKTYRNWHCSSLFQRSSSWKYPRHQTSSSSTLITERLPQPCLQNDAVYRHREQVPAQRHIKLNSAFKAYTSCIKAPNTYKNVENIMSCAECRARFSVVSELYDHYVKHARGEL